jgi:catalase
MGIPEQVRLVIQVKFYTQHGNWDLVGNNIPV